METTDHFEEEWRRRPEVPSVEELTCQQVFLPENIIDEPFLSVDEYLAIHFELIREDACSGLREAVCLMKAHPETEDSDAISVYENVRLIGLTYAKMGVCCKVSFSLNRVGKRIRWKNSKRLVPGSVVCISDDDFKTIKVATVAARPISGLEMDPPEVDLIFNSEDAIIDSSKIMVMVESRNGYYEAHKWTLRALQRMTADNFPLNKHICFLERNVPPPDYVKKAPLFDLSVIFQDNNDKEALEEVDILTDWPKNIQTSLDESQMQALKTILTRRLAIIQGPPGTGKTYTSVLALRALLHNMKEDDPPIVVACQTNHALDQILKAVAKHETNFVRLGGQSKDTEVIKPHTLYELRQKYFINVQGSQYGRSKAKMDRLREKMCEIMEPLKADLLAPQVFRQFEMITEAQFNSFVSGITEWVRSKETDSPEEALKNWLGDSVESINIMKDPFFDAEEGDQDYEAIQELEAEFNAVNTDDTFDDTLKGFSFSVCRSFRVRQPMGVTENDIIEALTIEDVWSIGSHLRPAIYCYLEERAVRKITDEFKSLNRQYEAEAKQFKIARLEKDYWIVSKTKLVGMTTTGLSKYRSLVASIKPKVILIEEAAEGFEGPIAVGCVPSVEHLILVGDHKQLKAHCAVKELEGDPYYLDMSMFERLISNNFPYKVLRKQRRMRSEFRELLTPIYNDTLEDHEVVLGRDPVPGMGSCNLFWWTHNSAEGDEATSKFNRAEAQMLVGFAEYLLLNGVKSENITILTFYIGQRSEISRVIRENVNLRGAHFKLYTVDGYQGEENDIILLSLVRSNPYGKIGFLGAENRVCVALSRAKNGFYIFGNAETVTAINKLWWDVGRTFGTNKIGYQLPVVCANHKERTLIHHSSDWINLDGGCKRDCRGVLPCKHVCRRKCHSFDHKDIMCPEPCSRILPCNHPCDKPCYEDDCHCKQCNQNYYREDVMAQEQNAISKLETQPKNQRAPPIVDTDIRRKLEEPPITTNQRTRAPELPMTLAQRVQRGSAPVPVPKGANQDRRRQQHSLGFNTYDKPGRAGYAHARDSNRGWDDGDRNSGQRKNTEIGMRDPEAEWRTSEDIGEDHGWGPIS
ncbi:hypothetical protein RUND412_000902 [Rhizina undulata]